MTTRAATKTESSGAAGAAASALTPEQTLIIQTRARTVPPRWRGKFLATVGDQLALTKSPTNKNILACPRRLAWTPAPTRAILKGIYHLRNPNRGRWP